MGKLLKQPRYLPVPNTHRKVTYNYFSGEILLDGDVYGLIRKGVYERFVGHNFRFRAAWDLSVINYFNPHIVCYLAGLLWHWAPTRTLLQNRKYDSMRPWNISLDLKHLHRTTYRPNRDSIFGQEPTPPPKKQGVNRGLKNRKK